jgi:hypothetical protein
MASNKRAGILASATRAREAQRRLAQIRHDEPIAVPKIAISVMAALHCLLTGYGKEIDAISISQIMELTGEKNEREVYKGVAWLRDNLIIERPRTKGGRGHRDPPTPTRFLNDAEARDLLQARVLEHDRRVQARVAVAA